MRILGRSRGPTVAFLVAGIALGTFLGLAACGTGSGNGPTLPSGRSSSGSSVDRPSARPPADKPSATRPESPDRATDAPTSHVPEKTAAPTREPTREATTKAAQPVVPPPATTRTAAAPKTPSPSGTPLATASLSAAAASDTSTCLGPLGWFLLIVLAALLIGGLVIWRSRRKASWVTGANTLAQDTAALVSARLPAVLSTLTAPQRALSWPPVRADLMELVRRWTVLLESAPGDPERDWSRQVAAVLQEIIRAVDAENEGVATGRDWQLLRPRVEDAEQMLSATLAQQPGAVSAAM